MDRKRAGKILTEHPEQEEFSLFLYARALRQITAQRSFRQQVGKKRRKNLPVRPELCEEIAELILEGQAQGRPIWIVDIILIEGKERPVTLHEREGGDGFAIQMNVQDRYVRHRHPLHQGRKPGAALLRDARYGYA